VLIHLPGKTEKEAWIITAYRDENGFEENRLVQKRFGEGNVQDWEEYILELAVGFLSRA
jgi:hypothetical protein